MALSNSYNYYTTRDDIIKRAFRIIGAISQGETPSATAVSEASITLNEIMKEWQADGLQLWKTAVIDLTGIIAGRTATIGASGQNITAQAPMQVLRVYHRKDGIDTPMLQITKDEYEHLSPKSEDGIPTQWYYKPPGAKDSGVNLGNSAGTFYWFPALSSDFITNYTMHAVVVNPLMDFDSSTDQPDVPDYLVNAVVWALADQLAYEYGVGLAERSMITKKAQTHKAIALSFDQEQGSLWVRPDYRWDNA